MVGVEGDDGKVVGVLCERDRGNVGGLLERKIDFGG